MSTADIIAIGHVDGTTGTRLARAAYLRSPRARTDWTRYIGTVDAIRRHHVPRGHQS